MLSVLIVDDEKWICELIRVSVAWDELDMKVCGIAHNGDEAIVFVKNNPVDIVITDIRMPGTDGLMLIAKIREMQLPINFIIVSGYQDFEYAKSAMQYQVSNYILKPIDDDELTMTLLKLKEEILCQSRQRANAEQEKSSLKSSNAKLREQLIRIIAKEGNAEVLKEARRELKNLKERFLCVIFRLDAHQTARAEESVVEILTDKLEHALFSVLADYDVLSVGFEDENGICIALNYSSDVDMIGILKNYFPDLRLSVNNYHNYMLTMGIGVETEDLSGLHLSYTKADIAVKYRLISGINKMIDGNKLPPLVLARAKDSMAQIQRSRFVALCEAADLSGIEVFLNEYFAMESIKERDPRDILDAATEMLEIFVGIYKTCEPLEDMEKEIAWISSVKSLREYVLRMIRRTLEDASNQKTSDSSKPVALVKEYILQNYASDITLQSAADYVYLTPSYLSTLFKKETGHTFMEFVQGCRIENAKLLLKDSAMKINKIANEVGYGDEKYFSKTFKKLTTLTPAEYRRLYT